MVATSSVRDLVALFNGDKYSYAYYHPFLIREVCRIRRPGSLENLRTIIYGHVPADRIDPDGYEVMERGYEMWMAEMAALKG